MFKEEISNAVMEKVFEYMQENNLIQLHVANKIGISRSYFNAMINGKRPINQWVLNQIKKGLGINIDVQVKVKVWK